MSARLHASHTRCSAKIDPTGQLKQHPGLRRVFLRSVIYMPPPVNFHNSQLGLQIYTFRYENGLQQVGIYIHMYVFYTTHPLEYRPQPLLVKTQESRAKLDNQINFVDNIHIQYMHVQVKIYGTHACMHASITWEHRVCIPLAVRVQVCDRKGQKEESKSSQQYMYIPIT